MKEKDFFKFKIDCNNKYCNRHTLFNEKTCLTEYKQNICYKKYLIQLEKVRNKIISKKEEIINQEIPIDYKYEEFKKSVWLRDAGLYDGISYKHDWQKYCIIWRFVLTEEEKKYVLTNFVDQLYLGKILDIVHLESRSRRPDLKYDINNVILGSRYFHSLLDDYKDLITQKIMSNDQREIWINRLKNYIKEINLCQ